MPNFGRLRLHPGPLKADRQISSAQPNEENLNLHVVATRCSTRMRIEARHGRLAPQTSDTETKPGSTLSKLKTTCGGKTPKEAPPPRAGKSSPSLRCAAGL